MKQSDKEYSFWYRFNEVDYLETRAWVFPCNLLKLYFVQGDMKHSQGTKMIYHVIKSWVSRKRGSELSNNVFWFDYGMIP
jgi:hypothetical protein